MQVLHLFDRYLNGTMNWAFQLISHCVAVEHSIAAPLFINNSFRNAPFDFWDSPFQRKLPKDEWSISSSQHLTAQAGIKSGAYQRFLLKQIKAKKPVLLHAHFAGVGWQALSLSKKSNLPLIVSFYGYDYEQLPFRKPIFIKRYQQLFQKAVGFLVEGPHGKKILKSMGCPENKITILPLGVAVNNIPFRKPVKYAGSLNMVQAATFTQKKGHLDAIKALEIALKTCPNISLTLLGEAADKNLFSELKAYISNKSLTDKITFLNFVDPGEFHNFLQRFDLFIHPSCYAPDRDCEGGAPIVLLDAQACGLPIISTEHCDIPMEVLHKKTGYLAPEKSILELAEGIQYFYNMDQDSFLAFAENARSHVVENFDVMESGKRLKMIYEELVGV